MADLVNEMLGKFAELAQEEKNISAEMDAAFKEYNDYCSSSDSDLSEKIQHYRKKIAKVEELMNYAREHAQPQDLEEAQMPFETSEGSLESIRQTIKLDSHNDPNAESLYTKASGMKLFYESELERTKKLIEGSKVQAKRQYDSDVAALEKRKIQHDADEKAYIQSEDFKQYLKLLSFDKSAFNSQGTVHLLDKSSISIGQRRVKLTVPMEVEQELSALSKGEYNSAARTIGAPFGVSTQNGSVLMLDFDERNSAYLLGGIQRLMLNFIKYFGQDLTDVFFCDPNKYDPDVLGVLSAMAKGVNPFIVVPQSIAEAQSKLLELQKQIDEQPVSGKISRIIVLNGFPENYGSEMTDAVIKISEAAEKSGVLLVLTHDNSAPQTEVEKTIRQKAVSIRSRNGAFWLESTRESLFWYSAPSEIPDDVRRIYVEQRRQQAAQAANEVQAKAPENVSETPAFEKIEEAQPENAAENPNGLPFGADENIPPHILLNLPRPKEETEISFESISEINETVQLEPEITEPVHEETVLQTASEEPVRENITLDEPVEQKAYESPINDVQAVENIDMTDEAAEEINVAAEPSEAIEAAEVIENSKPKGSRDLAEIVVGRDMDNKEISLDISGNTTYICGKNSVDRLAVIRGIINRIISTKHPDEAELWVFDKTGGLLNQIGENSPFLKYAVADGNPHVSMDIIETLGDELSSRALKFTENGWNDYSEVPANVYLPRIIAFINDFPAFLKSIDSAPKMFGRSSGDKLANIIGCCGKYGINLVLIGETFSENGEKPDVFKNAPVHCAAVMAGIEQHAELLLDGVKLYENQLESLKKVPANCAFVCVPEKDAELYLAKIFPSENPQKAEFNAVEEYSENFGDYVCKRVFFADRTGRIDFADREKSRGELLEKRAENEILLFMGEPCRLCENSPVILHDDFGENILAIAPALQKKYAANAVSAAILSLREQNIDIEILAASSNPVYKELCENDALDGIDVFEGEKGELRISELAKNLSEKKFVIVLGGDILLAAMAADDASADLKKLLTKGSRAGIHVMFVCGNANGLSNGLISLFRHKAVFPCPAVDAEKLLRFTECELPEGAFRLSDDYDEFTVLTYENCKTPVSAT
ncbi:MAG: hypothetical protein MSR67_05050 [Oscillospiraceae bacterium]|nr:hypothetical protein [Oscillospiraceae bacterium]